jgi:hypothetical protein
VRCFIARKPGSSSVLIIYDLFNSHTLFVYKSVVICWLASFKNCLIKRHINHVISNVVKWFQLTRAHPRQEKFILHITTFEMTWLMCRLIKQFSNDVSQQITTLLYMKRACELNKSHIISTDEDPGLRIESFAVMHKQNYYMFYRHANIQWTHFLILNVTQHAYFQLRHRW